MFGLGPMELALIAGIAILIFGPSQIPKLGKAAGETIRQARGIRKELEKSFDED